jgi:hypothetical protein
MLRVRLLVFRWRMSLPRNGKMNEKLQNKLFKKFPKLFARRKLDITESCMFWGIDCGDGWYDLIYQMSEELIYQGHRCGFTFQLEQVKEKFGVLTCYLHREWNVDREKYRSACQVIQKYSGKSLTTCEETGGIGSLKKNSNGHLKTLSSMSAELMGFKPVENPVSTFTKEERLIS